MKSFNKIKLSFKHFNLMLSICMLIYTLYNKYKLNSLYKQLEESLIKQKNLNIKSKTLADSFIDLEKEFNLFKENVVDNKALDDSTFYSFCIIFFLGILVAFLYVFFYEHYIYKYPEPRIIEKKPLCNDNSTQTEEILTKDIAVQTKYIRKRGVRVQTENLCTEDNSTQTEIPPDSFEIGVQTESIIVKTGEAGTQTEMPPDSFEIGVQTENIEEIFKNLF